MSGVDWQPVTAWGDFLPDGQVRPLAIRWEGEIFPVEAVYSVVGAQSIRPGRGHSGRKYRCRIAGRESLLVFTQGMWLLAVGE